MKNKSLLLIISYLLVSVSAQASWLSEITGIGADLTTGEVTIKPPDISAIPKMIENLPKDVSQALLNPAAPYLAGAIRWSKARALERNPEPIPAAVAEKLRPYFPPHIISKVRWTTVGGGFTIDAAIGSWLDQEGAVTLDDVIVFRGVDAGADVAMWAHELTHVIQYDNLGIDTFAFIYSSNWNSLEEQAKNASSMIMADVRAKQNGAESSYRSDFSAANSGKKIEWSQVNDIAKKTIDPASFIWIKDGMTGNNSPVTIVVTKVIIQDAVGNRQQIQIGGPNNVFAPHASGPLLSPPGYTIVGVVAAYESNP
jgi:hypothetical protein